MSYRMDWQQVVLNGGPPCFAVLDDEDDYYCGRAQRWEGHDGEHAFVPLEALLVSTQSALADELLKAIPEVGVTFSNGYEEWIDAPSYRESVVAAHRAKLAELKVEVKE